METYDRRYRVMAGDPAIIRMIVSSHDTEVQAKRGFAYRRRLTNDSCRLDIVDSDTGNIIKSNREV
jgi:hypothetical protein